MGRVAVVVLALVALAVVPRAAQDESPDAGFMMPDPAESRTVPPSRRRLDGRLVRHDHRRFSCSDANSGGTG
jgi:hypothetical protein